MQIVLETHQGSPEMERGQVTALDDAIARADEVLALDAESADIRQQLNTDTSARGSKYWADRAVRNERRLATAAPDLARALKVVADALDQVEAAWPTSIGRLRAAIERRLKEGK